MDFKSAFYIFTFLTVISLCNCYPEHYENEKPCVSAGGSCMPETECPSKIESLYLGLCPKQRKDGIECCHGISLLETRCQKLGGECFDSSSNCQPDFNTKRAEDCLDDQKCCTLI